MMFRWTYLPFFFVALSFGCGGSSSEKKSASGSTATATPQAAAGQGEGTDEETAEQQARQYVYSPVGKRDPFRSYLLDLESRREDVGAKRVRETEQFELDQYRLTALVTGTSQPSAMVEDPGGKGHVIRVGSPLGRNGGRVTRISNKNITVVEEFFDPTGRKVRVPITIKLPRADIGIGE